MAQDISIQKLDIGIPFQAGLITCFTQDKDGYMWFTTGVGGVFRYDGYSLISFKNQPGDPNSISSDRVECVAADSAGTVWFGHFSQGLDRYDKETKSFKHYRHHDSLPNSLISDNISALLVDHTGMLWIGTPAGLNRFDPSTNIFTAYRHDPADPASLSNPDVRALYEDSEGTIWVGTGSGFNENIKRAGGLNKLDQATGRFIRFMHDEHNPNSLAANPVRAIFEDSRGTLWIGSSGDGLHTLNRKTGIITRHSYDPLRPDQLSRSAIKPWADWVDDHITFINEDASGAILIGTFGGGLSRYDPVSNKVSRHLYFSDSTAYNHACWWAHRSRDGSFWLGTWLGAGLYKVESNNTGLTYHDFDNTIRAIYQHAPGQYSLSIFPDFFQYDAFENKKSLIDLRTSGTIEKADEYVLAFVQNKEGQFWLGTNYGRLVLFNPITGKSKDFLRQESAFKSASERINSLMLDRNENLWIAAGAGLEYLDTRSGQFTYYHDRTEHPNSAREITALLEDREGRIWLGSYLEGGIYQFNNRTKSFLNYFGNKGVSSKLFEDKSGAIWAGANDGLYKLHETDSVFISFVIKDIPFTQVRDIMEDSLEQLWIVCLNALFRIDATRKNVVRFSKGINFANTRSYGLTSYNPAIKSNELFFKAGNGFYTFNPADISTEKWPPEILISDFRIYNQKTNQTQIPTSLLAAIESANEIILTYTQNNISFEITPIHYSSPAENTAVYKLEPYDPEWRVANPGEKIYYFNVSPGKYRLTIRASNANRISSERLITLTIKPPWWRTWPAYGLYSLVFMGLLWRFILYMRNRAVAKEREKSHQQELAHAKEIEKAYTELKATQAQLIQSEKMASLGQLTAGIAHEIQNPLNFVNNFSEVNKELVDELQQELKSGRIDDAMTISNDIKDNEEKIHHHGKRADAIVKGMLLHSRASSGQKELTDINALADEYLRLSYHGMRAKDKTFNSQFEPDFDLSLPKLNVVPQDIGRVLLNLINNAFYACSEKANGEPTSRKASSVEDGQRLTVNGEMPEPRSQAPEAYQPMVTVSTKNLGDKVEIRVKDNGNGIPEEIRDKIFQPFFTTKPTGKGTGLGLSLSYDIIKAHKGTWEVKSKVGEGTEFVIQLPIE